MNNLKDRLINREEAIKNWLKENKLDFILNQADEILNALPKTDIKQEFKTAMELAFKVCAEDEDANALDFNWYYDGREAWQAFAYALESCDTEGKLANSDLGPDELPGIELELDHGGCIQGEFAELPVYHATSPMIEKLSPSMDKAAESKEIPYECITLITDYFQIWNYKLALEVCEELHSNIHVNQLKGRAPFWVTMTRHDRWSVGIMVIE